MGAELVSKSDLARHWGISTSRVQQLAALDSFPGPTMVIGRHKLYDLKRCDDWRAGRPKNGRPRKAA